MDRFFIRQEISQSTFIENQEDVKHISKVLRLRVNDKIEVVDSNEKEYLCEIIAISKDSVEYKVIEEVAIKRELGVQIKVYQGVPKGQKLDLIAQKLTEIGVYSITPVEFKRCVSSIKEEKEDKKIARLQRIIYEAAKQSKRNHIPKIESPMTFKELVKELKSNTINIVFYECEEEKEDKKIARLQRIIYEAAKQSKRNHIPKIESPMTFKELVKELKSNTINIVFYECEEENNLKSYFASLDLSKVESIGVIVGPEGGITPEEIELLESNGCKVLTLGARILRTETAAVVASAIIAYEAENIQT